MALVTLRVLDGADRGRVFEDVATPFTVGREEGNAVQLNDERISRFHLKIQEDQEQVVLTDLQSTNGTKVNGESVQLSILRPGDIISLGRTVLLFGSRFEIAQRLASLRGADLTQGVALGDDDVLAGSTSMALEMELNFGHPPETRAALRTLFPPPLPKGLTPGQAAQLAELLHYCHLRLRGLIQSARCKGRAETVALDQRQWQSLLDLQDRLAGYLRAIGEPS